MASSFDDTAMIRRVHREHVVALGGPRALLMQAAHPVAFAGFFASTEALEDPYPASSAPRPLSGWHPLERG